MEWTAIISELLRTRPDFLLTMLLVATLPILILAFAILGLAFPGQGKRRLVEELLKNPVVQERLKDPNLNVTDLIQQILKDDNPEPKRLGALAKVSHDITWDVSGVIGLIVTIVLMFMVVSRTYGDMPREIVAGWTTILGFYFGKATK